MHFLEGGARGDGVGDDGVCFGELTATQDESGGPHPTTAHADHFLAEFDELHKFGDDIEAEQWQKPMVQGGQFGFVALAVGDGEHLVKQGD